MTEVRVALVGPGAIGDSHARALVAAGCELVAAVGPKQDEVEAFARRHGIASTALELEPVLGRNDVDAVAVCSPSPVHAEQAVAALEAGKHVLCEIPAGLTLADTSAVAAAAEKAGRQAMVCHTMRFWGPVLALRRLVESGDVRPTHVVARSTLLRQENVGWTGTPRDWVDDVLWHHGAHVVDTALWLLDEPVATVAGLRGPDWPGSGKHMDVNALLATRSGRLAALALSYHGRVAVNDYLVISEEETYEIRDGKLLSSAGVVDDGGTVAAVQEAAVHAQDRHFVEAVAAGSTVRPAVADVLPAMEVLEQVQEGGRAWAA